MAVKLKKDVNTLVVTSFPKCIFGLGVLFLIGFWSSAFFSQQQLKIADYLIFTFVCLVVMAIQKHKVLSLNKQSNRAVLVIKSILGTKESQFSLADIKSVEMVYGRGKFARGGAVYLMINDQRQAIVDSDICFGNVERNIRVKEEISQWL